MLKREDIHPTFSFKLRGAYNKIANLDPVQRWRGNHGQAVAFSARKLKVPATIVVPEGAPYDGVRAISKMGGHVILYGKDSQAAAEEAQKLAARDGLIHIPPFDDPYVIAGQGTIGMELFRQTNVAKLEAVFCCIGGGGLISGIGVYIKRIAPSVKIIGVQTYDSNAMAQSLNVGQPVTLKDIGLFSGDASVKRVGNETFRICQEVVDDVIMVTTDEACAAIKDIFEDTRSIVEPAGALALAGLKKYVRDNPSSDPCRGLVAVVSGANMDFDRLRFITERAGLGDQKQGMLSVVMPKKPNAVAKLIGAVHPTAVMEINYRSTQDGSANVIMTVSLDARSRGQDLVNLLQRLTEEDMVGTDLSHNELAKSHVRYMVGGRSRAPGERLFTFEFPERQGAFYEFLRAFVYDFNVSLLHYFNRNGDLGRVVVGIQCSESDQKKLVDFLRNLKYPWREETENPAYMEFLRRWLVIRGAHGILVLSRIFPRARSGKPNYWRQDLQNRAAYRPVSVVTVEYRLVFTESTGNGNSILKSPGQHIDGDAVSVRLQRLARSLKILLRTPAMAERYVFPVQLREAFELNQIRVGIANIQNSRRTLGIVGIEVAAP
ncbi:hypothetical protein DL769_001060 [Monosporascus sp. CRB-8-3]|nr:hypothetical protein DL769_001060 [Monosporascus sp. CRB-8-3]